ncbi:hypothetical protein QTO34_010987 [Cnephaeus nilssonii]|uniref:C2H2-type domain-containing protein n=1 Tax=Cnephaeus nilssonii TaxID=3371016 RepID=A0AA40HCQ2_CNENI|nr:hypothetical protein QTO34_010987 [Eptesicus nilssonii]
MAAAFPAKTTDPLPCSSSRQRAARARRGRGVLGECTQPQSSQAGRLQRPGRASPGGDRRRPGGDRRRPGRDPKPGGGAPAAPGSCSRRRHNNQRPWVCATCGKAFFQASDLHVHQRIQARERPFRCGRCSRAFSHRTNLGPRSASTRTPRPTRALSAGGPTASPTYHRHLRMHQRKDSTAGPPHLGSVHPGPPHLDNLHPGLHIRGFHIRGLHVRASTSGDSMPRASPPVDTTPDQAPTPGGMEL